MLIIVKRLFQLILKVSLVMKKISELWCSHYKDLFNNCVQSTVQDVTNVDFDVNKVISPKGKRSY